MEQQQSMTETDIIFDYLYCKDICDDLNFELIIVYDEYYLNNVSDMPRLTFNTISELKSFLQGYSLAKTYYNE